MRCEITASRPSGRIQGGRDFDEGTSQKDRHGPRATDRVHGPPIEIVANPGDVIIFDKRLGHFGGPARSRAEIQQSGNDNTCLSDDPGRPITDASWHIHLDDREQTESLVDDGGDPVYYVHSLVSSGDDGRGGSLQVHKSCCGGIYGGIYGRSRGQSLLGQSILDQSDR